MLGCIKQLKGQLNALLYKQKFVWHRAWAIVPAAEDAEVGRFLDPRNLEPILSAEQGPIPNNDNKEQYKL